jgi:glycosyltransferase A (GT-A) superfamily protein (DUF2064 family)
MGAYDVYRLRNEQEKYFQQIQWPQSNKLFLTVQKLVLELKNYGI